MATLLKMGKEVNKPLEVLICYVVSRLGIKSQAVTPVWVCVPQVKCRETCPNMTPDVEQDVKPQF